MATQRQILQAKNGFIPAFVLLLLSGCSTLAGQPNFDIHAYTQTQLQNKSQWQTAQYTAESANRLLDLIHHEQIEALVTQALANNASLQQSILSLEIVKAQKQQTFSAELPTASLAFNQTQQENQQEYYSSELSVSWEIDIWNKLSDQTQAAKLEVIASMADTQAVKDSLIATVIRTWLTGSYQIQLIALEEERIATLQNNESLIKSRYLNGLGSLQDLDTARSDTATARATLEQYQEDLAQTTRQMAILLGKTESSSESLFLSQFPSVLAPLATLPAQDLANRPDLQNAYASILSADYSVNVAYKNLLPSINLQASLTDSSGKVNDALLASPLWGLLSQISAPLFQGGQLKAAKDIAEFQREIAFWQYQETLLTAINEVDNALGLERSLATRQSHTQDALLHAKSSETHVQEQYAQGLTDIFDLLTVQQQTLNLEVQALQLHFEQLTNRVDLGLALGIGA